MIQRREIEFSNKIKGDEVIEETNRDPHLKLTWRHHGFIGAAMFCVGLALVLVSPLRNLWVLIPAVTLMVVGGLLGLDDGVQHIVQHWRPDFRSPVNRLWSWFWRGFCD